MLRYRIPIASHGTALRNLKDALRSLQAKQGPYGHSAVMPVGYDYVVPALPVFSSNEVAQRPI